MEGANFSSNSMNSQVFSGYGQSKENYYNPNLNFSGENNKNIPRENI